MQPTTESGDLASTTCDYRRYPQYKTGTLARKKRILGLLMKKNRKQIRKRNNGDSGKIDRKQTEKVAYLISFGRIRKKRDTVTGRQEDGGVGVIDIESKFKALAAGVES